MPAVIHRRGAPVINTEGMFHMRPPQETGIEPGIQVMAPKPELIAGNQNPLAEIQFRVIQRWACGHRQSRDHLPGHHGINRKLGNLTLDNERSKTGIFRPFHAEPIRRIKTKTKRQR